MPSGGPPITQRTSGLGEEPLISQVLLIVAGQGAYVTLYAAYRLTIQNVSTLRQIKPYLTNAYSMEKEDVETINFLRTRAIALDIIYRTEEKSRLYAIWGGLAMQDSVYFEEGRSEDQYGPGSEKLFRRADLSRISDDWFDRLAAEHVNWLVTDPEDVAINRLLETPEGKRRAIPAAQFGEVRIYRLR